MNFDVSDLVRSNFLPAQAATHSPEPNKSSPHTRSLLGLVSYSLGEAFQSPVPVSPPYPQSEATGPLPLSKHLVALAEGRPFVPDSLEWVEGREAIPANGKTIYNLTESSCNTYVMEWQFPTGDREALRYRQNNFQLLHNLSRIGAPISPLIRSEIYRDGAVFVARAEFVNLGEGVDSNRLPDPFDQLGVARAALSSLEALHRLGVCHGDTPSCNWVITRNPEAPYGFEARAIDLDDVDHVANETLHSDRLSDFGSVVNSFCRNIFDGFYKKFDVSSISTLQGKLSTLQEMIELMYWECDLDNDKDRSEDVPFCMNMFMQKMDEILALRPAVAAV